MRRREIHDDKVPLRLLRFDAGEWGGGPDAAQLWYDALDEWRDAGNDITHPPGIEWPDVPFNSEMI